MRSSVCVVAVLMACGALFASEQEQKPVRLIAEAEDFKVVEGDWGIVPYRENYFSSTFAITFLSRMACLGAPAQIENGKRAIAEQEVEIPYDGLYRVLARYEQPYDFSVEFTVEIKQGRKIVYEEVYGRLKDNKIWALNAHKRLPMERFWWGGTDNIVWQDPGAAALKKGKARIRIIAGPQMDGKNPRAKSAKRHVDVICLTNDAEGMEAQKKTRYLEMDGWLVQEGDLFIRLKNNGNAPMAPRIVANKVGQHSPYYIHTRDWPSTRVLKAGRAVTPTKYLLTGPRSRAVKAKHLAPLADPARYKVVSPEEMLQKGDISGWIPIGGVLDALNNCTWILKVEQPTEVEFAVPDGKGGLTIVKKITVSGATTFEIPGNIAPNPELAKILKKRWWLPVIRTQEEALQWLLGKVKAFPQVGSVPERFFVYNIMGFGSGLNFATGKELAKALGDNTMTVQGKKRKLVAHWRETDVEVIKKNRDVSDVYVVSYGDEIHLPVRNPGDQGFAQWLKSKKIQVKGSVKYTTDKKDPLYYYSTICAIENGAKQYIAATAYYASQGARTGANYSPHANYLVTEMHYIRPFKMKAMSMPWSEDYVWQIPEFSVQVVGYLTSAFRAAAKYHDMPIHMYVMPHSPGNTPRDFRLSFYTCIAHGATMINYFCGSPMAVGGTENYVATDDIPMWRAIHDCTHEAGMFEDYVMDGRVRQARVGMILSSVDDIMTGVKNSSFAMHNNERKAIYFALRHAQVPVDFLSEDDIIDGRVRDYDVVYVTQQWLHSGAVTALKKWVGKGGTLVALCGGGFLNEFNEPNKDVNELYGVKSQELTEDPDLLKYLLVKNTPFLTKQDLPGYVPFDTVSIGEGESKVEELAVIVWKQHLTPSDGVIVGTFSNGKPAVIEKKHGKGRAVLFGFLPGQAYLKSGLPLLPADRGGVNESFAHWLPTEMDLRIRGLLVDEFLPNGFVRPVVCSEAFVETTCIDTLKPAKRLAVPLMNYSGKSIQDLTVRIEGLNRIRSVRSVKRAKLGFELKDGGLEVSLPLETADMLLINL